MIALLRPSRGLLFSESEDSCWRELRGVEHVRIASHDKPIPDCFNYVVEEALKTKADSLFFVEEDIVVPEGGLAALLALDADIGAISYLLKKGPRRLSEWHWQGKLIWVSLGCLLVKRKVFEKLPYPWFRSDRAIASRITGSKCDHNFLDLVERDAELYGGIDAFFCWQARQAGFTIDVVDGVGMLCRHLVLEQPGLPNVNDGCHRINETA